MTKPLCSKSSPRGYGCTRTAGHTGIHVATRSDGSVITAWGNGKASSKASKSVKSHTGSKKLADTKTARKSGKKAQGGKKGTGTLDRMQSAEWRTEKKIGKKVVKGVKKAAGGIAGWMSRNGPFRD